MRWHGSLRRRMIQSVLASGVVLAGGRVLAADAEGARPAADRQGGSVFVLPVSVSGEDDPELASQLQGAIASALAARTGLEVVTSRDIEDMLAAQKAKDVLSCQQNESCMADIRDKTDADLVLSPSVGRVGEAYLLTMSLLEPLDAVAVGRVGASAESKAALVGQIPDLIAKLFGESAADAVEFALSDSDVSFAVFDLDSAGVDEATVENLAQFVTIELSKVRGATVISPEDIASILGREKMKTILGADCDEECMVNISGALDVDYLIVGQVGRLESDYVLGLRLIDPRNVVVANRVTESMHGPPEELTRAIRTITRRLVGVDSTVEGRLSVVSPVTGGAVTVDGQPVGQTPFLPGPDVTFPARRVMVQVTKRGYYDWTSDVFVQPGEDGTVRAELIREPAPITKKWWFWTIIAGAVAGGTTAAIIAAQPDSSGGGGEITLPPP